MVGSHRQICGRGNGLTKKSKAVAKTQAAPLPSAPPVQRPAPTAGEVKAVEVARKAGRLPRVKSGVVQSSTGTLRLTNAHADSAGWEAQLNNAFGTSSKDFVEASILSVARVIQKRDGVVMPHEMDAILAVLDGAKPKDEIEAMLVTQMAITHVLAMRSARSLAKSTEIPQQDSNGLALHRLTKTFTTQIDALAKIRRGGEQRVIVEHVHVYPGGQAIVGNVTTTGGGAGFGNIEQPHAADDARAIALAGSSEVWRENAPGQPLPIAQGPRQEAMPDARGGAGIGSSIGETKRQLPARTFHRRRNGGTGIGAKVVA